MGTQTRFLVFFALKTSQKFARPAFFFFNYKKRENKVFPPSCPSKLSSYNLN